MEWNPDSTTLQAYVVCTPTHAAASKADSATQKQLDLVRMTENSKRTLEQEVSAYRCVCGAHREPAVW